MAQPKSKIHEKENYGATDKPKQRPPEPDMPAKQPDDNPAAESEGDSDPRSTPHQRDEERAV